MLHPMILLGSVAFASALSSVNPYVPPGPTDSRGPCPGLNTLANHGYINHDGQNIESQSILDAFFQQFGIDQSCIHTAMANALIVCEFTTGASCGTTLANLSLLAEPHAFEHDHSFSRQDYKMGYLANANGSTDNRSFNDTIFQTSLDVLGGATHMNYAMANEVRLQRESLALQNDVHGWFIEQKPIQEFEVGFIFAIMGDFNLPDYHTTPQVRIEWWAYWFTHESFPYSLGWHPPSPCRELDFVLSVSSAVLAQTVTSTPTPLPTGAIGPGAVVGTLPSSVNSQVYPLATAAPLTNVIETLLNDVEVIFKNPYLQLINTQDIVVQQAYAAARVSSAVGALATGLLKP